MTIAGFFRNRIQDCLERGGSHHDRFPCRWRPRRLARRWPVVAESAIGGPIPANHTPEFRHHPFAQQLRDVRIRVTSKRYGCFVDRDDDLPRVVTGLSRSTSLICAAICSTSGSAGRTDRCPPPLGRRGSSWPHSRPQHDYSSTSLTCCGHPSTVDQEDVVHIECQTQTVSIGRVGKRTRHVADVERISITRDVYASRIRCGELRTSVAAVRQNGGA